VGSQIGGEDSALAEKGFRKGREKKSLWEKKGNLKTPDIGERS